MIAKTPEDIQGIKASGSILADVLRGVARLVCAGVTAAELDVAAEKMLRARGAKPAFLHYKPEGATYPYPAALCVSVNDEIVHGIPTEDTLLAEGDLACIDLGLSYNGYFTDHAVTVPVGTADAASMTLVKATKEALAAAVAAAKAGARTGDIGAAVSAVAKRYGVAVVKDLGGHGVGKSVHEKPFIDNEGKAGEGDLLVEGMVLALEPMFSLGKGDVSLDEDGYTYRTRDGSRAAHFEHTVIVGKEGGEIVTL